VRKKKERKMFAPATQGYNCTLRTGVGEVAAVLRFGHHGKALYHAYLRNSLQLCDPAVCLQSTFKGFACFLLN
jgi:hypothetical protein